MSLSHTINNKSFRFFAGSKQVQLVHEHQAHPGELMVTTMASSPIGMVV